MKAECSYMDSINKRFFIGGLSRDVTENELKERFQKFGNIADIEIKRKDDVNGYQEHCFAHAEYTGTDINFKRLISTYNKTRWKGKTIQIAVAKESFLQRLKHEREQPPIEKPKKAQKKPSWSETVAQRRKENFEKAGIENFIMKKAVPGTGVPGEKNYIVGKFGRVMPVVYLRRKDKQKIMKYDPSKFAHHLKVIKDEKSADSLKQKDLTWTLKDKNDDKNRTVLERNQKTAHKPKRVVKNLHKRPQESESNRLFENETSDDSSSSSSENELIVRMEGKQNLKKRTNQSLEKDMIQNDSRHGSTLLTNRKAEYTSGSSDEDNLMAVLKEKRQKNGVKSVTPTSNLSLQEEDVEGKLIGFDSIKTSAKVGNNSVLIFDTSERLIAKRDSTDSDESDGSIFLARKLTYFDEETVKKVRTMSQLNEKQSSPLKKRSDIPSDVGQFSKEAVEEKSPLKISPLVRKNATKRKELEPGQSSSKASTRNFNFDLMVLDRQMIDNENGGQDKVSEVDRSGSVRTKRGGLNGPIIKREEVPEFKGLGMMKNTAANEFTGRTENSGSSELSSSDNVETEFLPSTLSHSKGSHSHDDSSSSNNESKVFGSNEESSDGASSDGEKGESLERFKNLNEESIAPKVLEKGQDVKGTTQAKNKWSKEDRSSKNEEQNEPSQRINAKEQLNTSTEQRFEQRLQLFASTLNKGAAITLTSDISHESKAELSNQKRLQAVQNRQLEYKKQRSVMRSAISALDSREGASPGTHVRFDSDDEGEEKKREQGDASDEDNNTETLISPKKAVQSTPLTLFNDDSEEDDDDDADIFKIKPQFEGEKGSKLMKLQDRFGGDRRFKLDARFIDDDDAGSKAEDSDDEKEGGGEKDDNESEGAVGINAEDLKKEKAQSLSVLASVLGRSLMTPKEDGDKNVFKNITRFDPTSKDHQKYLKKAEPSTEESKTIKAVKMEEKPLPEVSQERFFEVKGNLKSAFMGGSNLGSDKPFSFFGGDDKETADTKKSDEDQSSGFLLSRTFGLNSSKLPYDSSDSEDEDLTQTDVKHDEKSTSKVKETVNPVDLTVVQKFFFSLNDPRLKAGPLQFYRSDSKEALTARWEGLRSELESRKRHRKAVRDGRHRHIKRKKH